MEEMPKLENQKEKREILGIEQIREHFKNDKHVIWVKAGQLREGTEESCVDGRQETGLIGTPGGNAGEFILFLASLEKCGTEVDEDQMDSILERYLEKFGKFYIHTDEHALERAEISQEELENPSKERKEKLLEVLANTNNMGCGHLKHMVENAEEYGVRPELAREAIKSVIKAYWDANDNIDFEVLEGDHKEGAVVNVLVEGDSEIADDTEVPTVSPSVEGAQMFVNHPQVSEFLRKLEDKELEYIIGIGDGTINHSQFKEEMRMLAEKQLGLTVQWLAKGLPVYNVVFRGKEIVSIEQTGQIEN